MKIIAIAALLGLVSATDVEKAAPFLLGHKGENPTDKIHTAELVAGLIEPFVGKVDPLALMECVLGIDEILMFFSSLVAMIEGGIKEHQYFLLVLIGGFMLVGEYHQAQIAI